MRQERTKTLTIEECKEKILNNDFIFKYHEGLGDAILELIAIAEHYERMHNYDRKYKARMQNAPTH